MSGDGTTLMSIQKLIELHELAVENDREPVWCKIAIDVLGQVDIELEARANRISQLEERQRVLIEENVRLNDAYVKQIRGA